MGKSIYTVIEVWRGMVADVQAFNDRESAEECFEKLSAKSNEIENDLQILEVSLE